MSVIPICLFVPMAMQVPSGFLSPNFVSISWLAWQAICSSKAYGFGTHHILNRWRTRLRIGHKMCYACFGLWLPGTRAHMSTYSWRCHLVHLWYSGYHIKTLHKLPKYFGWGCIKNNPSFRLKHPSVLDGSDGSDGTSYPLMENYALPVPHATGRVA
jgi:hypothetical protein